MERGGGGVGFRFLWLIPLTLPCKDAETRTYFLLLDVRKSEKKKESVHLEKAGGAIPVTKSALPLSAARLSDARTVCSKTNLNYWVLDRP